MSTRTPRIRTVVSFLCATLLFSGTAPLMATTAVADELPFTTLPGEPTSRSTQNWQRRADTAFEEGNYERAHRIFLNKLARKGDKYAHYMLGHLNEQGLGVPKDSARALAWYALSAERGSDGAKARAYQLTAQLSESEQQRANVILAELMERFGDRNLLVRAIKRDMRELRKQTGTRVGSNSSNSRVFMRDGFSMSSAQYYGYIEDRIQFRTQLLGGNVTLGEFELIDPPEEDEEEDEDEDDDEDDEDFLDNEYP